MVLILVNLIFVRNRVVVRVGSSIVVTGAPLRGKDRTGPVTVMSVDMGRWWWIVVTEQSALVSPFSPSAEEE